MQGQAMITAGEYTFPEELSDTEWRQIVLAASQILTAKGYASFQIVRELGMVRITVPCNRYTNGPTPMFASVFSPSEERDKVLLRAESLPVANEAYKMNPIYY